LRKFLKLARRRPITILALVVLAVMLFLTILGPVTAPHDPDKMQAKNRLQPPNIKNWFGTDHFGRDMLSRIMVATRLTLGTSLCILIIIAFFGIAIGSISGYYPSAGAILMRLVDATMAFPSRLARLVHGITLTIATNTYVSAAKAVGVGEFRILTRYVILNAVSPIIVQCSFQLAHIILILAILDFLGVGFPPDVPSWGNMIATARIYITRAPWLLIFPGVAISLTVISINIVGDTLRDAFDPHAQ